MISRQQIIRGQQSAGPAQQARQIKQSSTGSGASSCASSSGKQTTTSSGNSSATSGNGNSKSLVRSSVEAKYQASRPTTTSRQQQQQQQNYSLNQRHQINNQMSKIMSRQVPPVPLPVQQQQQQQQTKLQLNDHRNGELIDDEDDDLVDEIELDVQQDSSDGYIMNQYDDYIQHPQSSGGTTTNSSSAATGYWKANHHRANNDQQVAANHRHQLPREPNYRHFDPYSIYSEDEDVWYSEERLFEDHLDEIFNKWRLLDDDIWCKLIIMERNRRIGKAYARVPIVTIDGSHELSYDGYKLALNGFDNPERDAKTEECKKRIGKGIRIKMDSFGNILIKRLSKSGVYVKEWLSPESLPAIASGDSGANRLMPSRQQLIKNHHKSLGANLATNGNNSMTPASSSTSGGSSMEPPNDSAVCDEVLSIGGRLEQDKIYVMFDIKKFQANITQELCRQFPDKKKLEQQCFSIIGLVRDTDDILNLPCWVMVINIVAIQMLNERFPVLPNLLDPQDDLLPAPTTGGQQRRRLQQAPSFVSIFDQQPTGAAVGQANGRNGNGNGNGSGGSSSNKEEDPYSLPANASSSDVKSSINDYGSSNINNSNGNNINRKQAAAHLSGSRRAEMYANKSSRNQMGDELAGGGANGLRHRSKSNNNIYGRATSGHQQLPQLPPTTMAASRQHLMYQQQHNERGNNQHSSSAARQDRYNNSSSIYSPGHMLVPPPGDPNVPPKLPPRDFVLRGKSRSSSNVQQDNYNSCMMNPDGNEEIYSTGMVMHSINSNAPLDAATSNSSKTRKVKKNRFLESLKAPLAAASSATAAALPAKPPATGNARSASVIGAPINGKPADEQAKAAKSSTKSSTTKNLKSFLGVKSSKSKQKSEQPLDTSASDDSNYVHLNGSDSKQSDDAGSGAKKAGNYNDLDIPTPDYETDENVYGLENNNYAPGLGLSQPGTKSIHHEKLLSSATMATKANGNSAAKKSGGQSQMGGSRYRSASMQRYYPSATTARSQYQAGLMGSGNQAARAYGSPAYGACDDPYGMHYGTGGNHLIDPQGHYGIIGGGGGGGQPAANMGGHRRRPSSRVGSIAQLHLHHQQQQQQQYNSHHQQQQPHHPLSYLPSQNRSSNYDIGRSSSGIYGNNSSSSSSDYADWQPQMRKVNSGGYLNSIFKSHLISSAPMGVTADLYGTSGPITGSGKSRNGTGGGHYAPSSVARPPSTTLSKQHHQQDQVAGGKQSKQHQQQQQQVVIGSAANGSAYRSYDSSNDSEPSYTNSSDGLDIYDHIGQQQQLSNGGRISRRHQFLNMQGKPSLTSNSAALAAINHNNNNNNTLAGRTLTAEVHVGEWENMYDR